jgi:hypothetical protein
LQTKKFLANEGHTLVLDPVVPRMRFPQLWRCRLDVIRVTDMDTVATIVKPTLTALYDKFVTFSRQFDKYHFFLHGRLRDISTWFFCHFYFRHVLG